MISDDHLSRSIYFIRPVGFQGPIKIGCSLDAPARMRTIQRSSPFDLEIIALIQGSRFIERQFHARFEAHHLRNEWFSAHPDILAAVSAIKADQFDLCSLPPPKLLSHPRWARLSETRNAA